MRELRIGFAPADFSEWAEEAARPAFAAGAGNDAGSWARSWWKPSCRISLTGRFWRRFMAAERPSVFEPLIASGKVDELADQEQIAGLKAGLEIPAKDYLKAMRVRRVAPKRRSTSCSPSGCAAGAGALRSGAEGQRTARSPSGPAAPEGCRPDGADSGGQSGGASGAGAALRIRGRSAGGDAGGGPAVYGETLLAIGKEFQAARIGISGGP